MRLSALVSIALAVACSASIACASGGTLSTAGAPAAPSRKALRDACRDDYQRLCARVPRGDGRIAACFQAHADELSPGCRSALADWAAARAVREGGARRADR